MLVTFGKTEAHLRDYLYILRKRRRILLAFFAFSIIASVTFSIFERVVYRATSVILIERENPNIVNFKEVMTLDASSTDYYQTQYLMLKSESLISKLIKNCPFNLKQLQKH